MEHPTMAAISLCSYPSTSCKTKILRYPGGSASTARCNRRRSIELARTGSCAPSSFFVALQRFVQRDHGEALFAQLHQDNVYRHPVQPRRKGRFASKGGDLAKQL